jgi:hypothetical protein
MELASIIKSAWEVCQNSPGLFILAVVGICAFVFIILDAHRHRKKRPRHRLSK